MKIFLLRCVFFLFLFSAICLMGEAADFRHISQQEGLSSNRVFNMEKDQAGFIWFATRQGIDRFDGSRITSYKLMDKDGVVDLGGRANYVVRDRRENLWAFTNDGYIYRYDELLDRFVPVYELQQLITGQDIFLSGIYFDASHRMYVYGPFGLHRLEADGVRMTEILPYRSTDVTAVLELSSQHLLVGTRQGLFLEDISREVQTRLKGEMIVPRQRIHSLHYQPEHQMVWIGTFSGQLFEYDVSLGNVRRIPAIGVNVPIRKIILDNETLYLASDGMGVICLDYKSGKIIRHYVNREDDPFSIASNSVYDVLLDDELRLWLTTYTSGVSVLDLNLPTFRFVQHSTNNRSSLVNNYVSALLEDSDGDMWYGTENGISLHRRSTGQWHHFLNARTGNEPLSAGFTILSLCEGTDKKIWAGGFATGAICIDKSSMQIEKRLSPDSVRGIGTNHIYAIFCDSRGTLWFGGLHGKLTAYQARSNRFVQYPVDYVNVITEHRGVLYVGTTHGLYVLDRQADGFVEFEDGQFSRHFISSLYFDSHGKLWTTTEKGLFSYDFDSREFDSYGALHSPLSGTLYSIQEDRRGRLWMSGENGLICFDPERGNLLHLGKREGLRSERFIARAAIRERSGEFTYGTSAGTVSLIPESIDKIVTGHRFAFTDFRVGNRPVLPGEPDSPLSLPIDRETAVRLKHEQNNFSFRFTCINYTNPDNIRFEWQLEGYDHDRISLSNQREAHYASVPAGKYTFVVQAVDPQGNALTPERRLPVTVDPPWWLTGLAKFVYFLLGGVFVWLAAGTIRNRINKRRSEEKIEFFTNTAHEIRTPISLILGPLSQLAHQEQTNGKNRELLDLALANTGKLNRLVTQLLDFQKTEMSMVRLQVTRQSLNRFVCSKYTSFQQLAIQKSIRFEYEDRAPECMAWFDGQKIDIIINNLLSNAIKYTPEGGTVRVWLTADDRCWTLNVEDNGIGIPKRAQGELFNRFFRADNVVNTNETGSGIGLMLCRNLTLLHRGNIRFTSTEGEGSFFSVTFPLDDPRYGKTNAFPADRSEPEISGLPGQFPALESPSEASASLLLVDDNEEMLRFLAEVLSPVYTVYTAPDGERALELLNEVLPDIVITDVMMPGVNGFELTRRIRQREDASHIPVILLTALDEKESQLKGYRTGADHYLVKPFDVRILRQNIENILSARRTFQQRLMQSLTPVSGAPAPAVEMGSELDRAFMDKVIGLIDKNLDAPGFSIDELCREVGMSRTSFYNKLKALTDQSPNDFIRIIRLNKAAALISEQRYSVSEVADRTGFGDVKYFSKAFKKYFGVTPSRYGKS